MSKEAQVMRFLRTQPGGRPYGHVSQARYGRADDDTASRFVSVQLKIKGLLEVV